MTTLSTKQLTILSCIHEAIEANGYPPTVREIGAAVGLASTSTVHGHLARLERAGYIIRDASKTRAIELSPLAQEALGIQPQQIPLLGQVAAGAPILAIEHATDYYPIPPGLERYEPSELFMLEIKGESMVNIGILDGDYITVRRQASANNGDVGLFCFHEMSFSSKNRQKSQKSF